MSSLSPAQPLPSGSRDPCQLLSTHGLSRRAQPRLPLLPAPRQHLTSAGLAQPGPGEPRSTSSIPLHSAFQGLASPPLHPTGSPASHPGQGDGSLKRLLKVESCKAKFEFRKQLCGLKTNWKLSFFKTFFPRVAPTHKTSAWI